MIYNRKCMKSTDKVVIHSYIVLPMGGIIVKMDYSPFGLGTSGGFANHLANGCLLQMEILRVVRLNLTSDLQAVKSKRVSATFKVV